MRFSQATQKLPDSLLIKYFDENAESKKVFIGQAIEPSDIVNIFYVVSGWLQRRHNLGTDRYAVSGTYVPGDIINLDTLCEDESLGIITALTNATVMTISTSTLRTAMLSKPQLAFDALRRSFAECDWLREAVAAHSQLRTRERIIYFIGQTRRRQIAYGTVSPIATKMDLPFSQIELAATLGVSHVHLSRQLTDLRAMALLDVRAKQVWFLNLERFDSIFANLL